jgi:hypothetical protein
VIETVVTTVLIGIFLLIAGFAGFVVRGLLRATAPPGEDG